jgi:hypothetical protein
VSGRRRRRRAARPRRTGGAGTPAAVSPWPGPAELMTKKQQVPAPITHSPCGGRLQEVGTRSGSEREKQRGRSLSLRCGFWPTSIGEETTGVRDGDVR